MKLRYNTPEVIDWLTKNDDRSYEDKKWVNELLESYDFMYILNLPFDHSDDDGTIVFFVTKENNDKAQDALYNSDYSKLEKVARIVSLFYDSDKEKYPIIFNNIGTCIKLKSVEPLVLPTMPLSDFYNSVCNDNTLVKPGVHSYLFSKLAEEFYQYDAFYMTIKEDLSGMPLNFFETWEDLDSSQKYGLLEYAVTYNNEIIGRISRSGKWLSDFSIDIFEEYKALIGKLMAEFVTVKEDYSIFSNKVEDALTLFKHSDFNTKAYS